MFKKISDIPNQSFKSLVNSISEISKEAGLSTLSDSCQKLSQHLSGCDAVALAVGTGVSVLPQSGSFTISNSVPLGKDFDFTDVAKINPFKILNENENNSCDDIYKALKKGIEFLEWAGKMLPETERNCPKALVGIFK